MAHSVMLTSSAEETRTVAGTVVAHDTQGFDTQGGEVSQGSLEQEHGAVFALIRHDLSESQAGSIIDADMDILPAGPSHLITPISRQPVTRPHGREERSRSPATPSLR